MAFISNEIAGIINAVFKKNGGTDGVAQSESHIFLSSKNDLYVATNEKRFKLNLTGLPELLDSLKAYIDSFK